jgi:glycosyltransferase involved in cell wall biosynthesis
MKILMLTPYLPYPPSSGGQVRSFNLIKNLSINNEVTLVSLVKTGEQKELAKELKKYCKEIYPCKRSQSPWTIKNILFAVFGYYPFLVVRNYSQEAEATIKKLLKEEKFDLIHAETFYIMPHIPKTNIPILLVEQTIEYQVYHHFVKSLTGIKSILKPFMFFDIWKLKMWEEFYWKKADMVATVSQSDKDKMLATLPELDITVVPNGAGEDLMNIFEENKDNSKKIFLYQGNFSWLQNIEAAQILAQNIFPKIKEKIPDAICYIAGQNANKKILDLAHDDIKIIDIETKDIETVIKIYKEASIFLAPIEGPGGTRLKVLGAMAAGMPVIASKVGTEGLAAKDGQEVLIARSDEEYADLSKKLLDDKGFYEMIRHNARKLIEEKYSYQSLAKLLEEKYRIIIDNKKIS